MREYSVLKTLHNNKRLQLLLGLLFGIIFGFLLQKGQVTRYNVLIGQLLLTDFTVIKIILSAIAVGMLGVHLLVKFNLAELHIKPGSAGASLPGGILFGIGFGLLGYCPGTISGASGQGSLDAILAGVPGIIIGTMIFASLFPKLDSTILNKGDFGKLTIDKLIGVSKWTAIAIVEILIILTLLGIEFFYPTP